MNKKQEQRLNSLRVIYSIAMDRQEIISKVELFREGIEALGKVIEEIETVGSQQIQDISGVNVQKLMSKHQQNLISTGMFLIEEVKKIPMSFLAKGGYTEADLKAIESSYEEFYMLYTEPRMRINERNV